jgi:hypothetical protein
MNIFIKPCAVAAVLIFGSTATQYRVDFGRPGNQEFSGSRGSGSLLILMMLDTKQLRKRERRQEKPSR